MDVLFRYCEVPSRRVCSEINAIDSAQEEETELDRFGASDDEASRY